MRKPTVNQMKWQAILNQTQKALAEITKVTGEIFDEAELRPERPQRITEKKLSQLKETQLDFIHKQVEDVIKNMRTPEAEELAHKVRTKEQYIRHPRISKGKKEERKGYPRLRKGKKEYVRHPLTPSQRSERARKAWKTRFERMTSEEREQYSNRKQYEPHPLTYAERSERAKKAWQTRLSRMTPEQREQYGKDFAERMKKAREAKELERKGYEAPPEAEEPVSQQDWNEVLGEALTPEEVQELDYAKAQAGYIPELTDIIDYSVESALIGMLDDPDVIPERISELVNVLNEFKNKLGDVKYYQLLNENANDILDYSSFWLTYRHEPRARTFGLNKLMRIFAEGGLALDLTEALKNSEQYDTEMLDLN